MAATGPNPEQMDTEDTDADERTVTLNRDQIRALERDAKETRAARRELAFVKAGIDTDTPLGQMFFDAYKGDLTSEAIKEAAATIGLGREPEPETPSTPPEEQSSTGERRNLASGATGDLPPNPDDLKPDPRKEARDLADKVLADGGSREEAMARQFSTLVQAAQSGDRRVILE